MKINHARHLTLVYLLTFLALATGCDSGGGALTGTEQPEDVSEAFTIRTSKGAVTEGVSEGTFELSGTLNDRGDVREVLSSSEPLNRRSSLHGRMTLVSDKGSITITFYAGLSRVDRERLRASGGFYIEEATGAYAGLEGGGRINRELAADASLNEVTRVLEGVMRTDGLVHHSAITQTVPSPTERGA